MSNTHHRKSRPHVETCKAGPNAGLVFRHCKCGNTYVGMCEGCHELFLFMCLEGTFCEHAEKLKAHRIPFMDYAGVSPEWFGKVAA